MYLRSAIKRVKHVNVIILQHPSYCTSERLVRRQCEIFATATCNGLEGTQGTFFHALLAPRETQTRYLISSMEKADEYTLIYSHQNS